MPITVGQDSAKARKTLSAGNQSFAYYSIPAAEAAGLGDFSKLPAALKVVLENMLRFEDGKTVTLDDIKAFAAWAQDGGKSTREIAYRPARVLMQDFTGVPAVVDLAAMRDGIKALGGDPQKINPLNPVDLVIDHSVMIDEFGNPRAFQMNVDREYERNLERYTFLKWGQKAFNNFRVVPPGTGICHQVNLEYLAQTVWTDEDQNGEEVAYPDTLVGTDSHTTMVNGAAVLGWGVGGIEAEAAMLGQPISMLIPEVVGFKLTGKMVEGTTGTDLVLDVPLTFGLGYGLPTTSAPALPSGRMCWWTGYGGAIVVNDADSRTTIAYAPNRLVNHLVSSPRTDGYVRTTFDCLDTA